MVRNKRICYTLRKAKKGILLKMTYATKAAQAIPVELLENEEYMEAKKQQDTGGNVLIAGILMMAIPFILLLILGELHDFLASVGLITFFLGILTILIGLLLVFGAGKALAKLPVEMVKEPKSESRAGRFFMCLAQ